MKKPRIELLKFRKSVTFYQLSKQSQYDQQTRSFKCVRLVLVMDELGGFQEGKYIQDIMKCAELKQYLTDD